ncbi:TPA: IS3 family transposase [Pseudomonas putida]
MKKARYSEEQIVRILREADRDPVADVAKRHGVSEQSIYGWRKRYGEFGVDEVRRLKEIETENARLRKLLVERDLEIEAMKEVNPPKVVSVQVRQEQARLVCSLGVSQRRACALYDISRSGLRYLPTKAGADAPVVARMRALSAQYPRYGYRRISIFLAREGHVMSMSRAQRLWALAGLQVPRKRPRRRVAASRPRPMTPSRANQVWSYDFVFDACANGQQIKCLTLVDEYTRECLAIDVSGSIRSGRVIEVLARVISRRGTPRYLRSDNGPEFVSRALLEWIVDQGIETALIDPGKPWQNGTTESFNGKLRDECLNMEWFRNRTEARLVIEDWREHYNTVRPHSSLGYLTPRQAAMTVASRSINEARLQIPLV